MRYNSSFRYNKKVFDMVRWQKLFEILQIENILNYTESVHDSKDQNENEQCKNKSVQSGRGVSQVYWISQLIFTCLYHIVNILGVFVIYSTATIATVQWFSSAELLQETSDTTYLIKTTTKTTKIPPPPRVRPKVTSERSN